MSKVWFVTGANSGIGAGVAKAVLQAGDRVVATGRNMDKLRAAYADAAEENIALVRLDVSDETQAQAVVTEAVTRFGRIDVLVNNAGYSLLGQLRGADHTRHRRLYELLTHRECGSAFLKGYVDGPHGNFVWDTPSGPLREGQQTPLTEVEILVEGQPHRDQMDECLSAKTGRSLKVGF